MFGKSQRCVACAAASVCSLGLILALGTKSLGQSDEIDVPKRSIIALQEQQKSAAAMRLARERYQFLRRLSPEAYSPIWDGGEFAHFALFPFGQSDRVYIIAWNDYWSKMDGDKDCIFCYQRIGAKDKLVYKVHLDFSYRSNQSAIDVNKKPHRFDSVKDIFADRGIPFKGPVSKYAKADLESPGNYVYYDYLSITGTLKVMSLANFNEQNLGEIEVFDISRDPITQEKLKTNGFYQKYGLPVSFNELKALQPHLPAELTAPLPAPCPCDSYFAYPHSSTRKP